MKEYKLFKLLGVLEYKELKELKAYIGEGKSNEGSQNLLEALSGFHPNFDNAKLTKENLFKKLFKKMPYDDGKMRKLMTQLSQFIERFLMEKELKVSEDIQAKLLTKALASRSNYGLFLETVESRLNLLEKAPERGRDYYRECYELCDLVFFHKASNKLIKRSEFINRATLSFERYFTLVTLQNSADNVVRTRLVKEKNSSIYNDFVKQASKLPELKESRSVALFSQIVSLLEGNEAEDLELLKTNVFISFKELSRFEQDIALNLVRNYAVPLSNEGSRIHTRFVLDLYKLELEGGREIDTIGANSFINIVSIGLTIEEFDWVEYFMTKYSQFLPAEEYESTLNYCQGLWLYQKGVKNNSLDDFYLALQSVNRIPTRSIVYLELRVRNLSVRIHFEFFLRGKESLDEALNQIRNFERHITTNTEYSDTIRNSYLDFLRHLKSLARTVADPNSKRRNIADFLMNLTNLNHNFIFKSWLLEKAKGLAELS